VEDLLPESSAYRQASRVLLPKQRDVRGRPLTPLHGGHVGLLCTAGMLNGVFGEGKDRHIAHWRSVKFTDHWEEQEEDGTKILHDRERSPTNSRWSSPTARLRFSRTKRRNRREERTSSLRLAYLRKDHRESCYKYQTAPGPLHRRGIARPSATGKAHLVSVIGGDTQIAAVSAAISMGERFMVEGQGVPPIRVCLERNPQCYKGSLQLPGRKKPLRHLIGVSEEFAASGTLSGTDRTLLADSERRSCGRRWRKFTASQEFQIGPSGFCSSSKNAKRSFLCWGLM